MKLMSNKGMILPEDVIELFEEELFSADYHGVLGELRGMTFIVEDEDAGNPGD